MKLKLNVPFLRRGTVLFACGLFMSAVSFAQLPTASQLAGQMTIGWNVGNSLEVPTGETGWGNPMVTEDLILAVKAAGFNTIRIPCAWNSYADQSTYQIQSSWLARVKEVVDYGYNNGMFVILNSHWDNGWLEENPYYSAQDEVNAKQDAYWTQVANYFEDYGERLLFAGANEIRHGYDAPNAENVEVQQSYLQTFVDAVRATGGNNASRTLIVQTYNTNIWHGFDYFALPNDNISGRLMVEVHHYDPYDFTLNSANTCIYWGSPFPSQSACSWAQESYIDDLFSQVASEWTNQGIPVVMGEYGAMYRTDLGDPDALAAREYWLEYNTAAAVDNGVIPVYWDNGYSGNNGFALFDRNSGSVVDQGGIDALMAGAGIGNPDNDYILTTNVSGNGSVNLSPSGGLYPGGTTVTVTANPASGYDFLAWSGDLSGSDNPTSITMNSNKSITAIFVEEGSGGSGTILREYWNGIQGTAVSALTSSANYPNNPTGSEQLTSIEGPTNVDDYYGTRIRGYIHPPVSGTYTFWVAGDDYTELYLSTNNNPANANLIASVGGWTNSRQWDKYSSQQSSGILLTGGNQYYIEVLHKEGSGGDNVAVAWEGPGISRSVIGSSYISPFEGATPENNPPNAAISASPISGTAPLSVSFNAGASSDPDGDNLIYSWNFGDGATASGVSPSHTYTSTGSFAATVTVSDGSLSDQVSITINVSTSNIAVNGVSVSPTSSTLTVGQTVKLNETVLPTNATNQNVSWSSSNNSVASVNSSGLVTANAAGSATVTVTTQDGSYTAIAGITVEESSGECTWVEYQAEDGTLSAGSMDSNNSGFTGTGFANTDNVMDVWYEIAVNVPSAGVHDIRVRYANGSSLDRTQEVSVGGSVQISSLSFPATGSWTSWTMVEFTLNLSAGNNTIRFTSLTSSGAANLDRIDVCQGGSTPVNNAPNAIVSASPTGGTAPLSVSFNASGSSDPDGDALSYTWTFGDGGTGSGATPSHTYNSTGNYTATVTVSDGELTDQASVSISVSSGTISVTGVTLSTISGSLTVGQTVQLNAAVSPSSATNQTISWSSNNSPVASVNSSGLVTAQAVGSAAITVTTQDGGYTASASITVTSGGTGEFCDNPVSISVPFVQDGAGQYCFVTTTEIAYINSWAMNELTINGVDFTNTWSNSLPAAVNGEWVIYYDGSASWSHFEAPAAKSLSTSIADVADVHVKLYPNPFNESINLEIDKPQRVKNVVILDQLGRQVGIINQSSVEAVMEIGSELDAGMYYIRVNDTNNTQTFVISKTN